MCCSIFRCYVIFFWIIVCLFSFGHWTAYSSIWFLTTPYVPSNLSQTNAVFVLSAQWVDNNICVVLNSSICILLFIIAVLDTLQWLPPYIKGHYMFSLVSFLTTVTYVIVDMFCIEHSICIIFKMTSKSASPYSRNIIFDSLISILAINRSVIYCLYFFYNFFHRKTFKK